MVDSVERIARETPGVVDVEKIRLRWVGHALETNLSITVDQDLTVMDGHAISEEVRHRLAAPGLEAGHGRDPREPVRPRRRRSAQVVRHHEARSTG